MICLTSCSSRPPTRFAHGRRLNMSVRFGDEMTRISAGIAVVAGFSLLAVANASVQELPTRINLNRSQATALGFSVKEISGSPNEVAYLVFYPSTIRHEYQARSTIVIYRLKGGGRMATRTNFLVPSKSPEVVVGTGRPFPHNKPSVEVFYKCVRKVCSKGLSVQYVINGLQSFLAK